MHERRCQVKHYKLAPGWSNLPTDNLRQLRYFLSFRMMQELDEERMEEAVNLRDLAQAVRAEINSRPRRQMP